MSHSRVQALFWSHTEVSLWPLGLSLNSNPEKQHRELFIYSLFKGSLNLFIRCLCVFLQSQPIIACNLSPFRKVLYVWNMYSAASSLYFVPAFNIFFLSVQLHTKSFTISLKFSGLGRKAKHPNSLKCNELENSQRQSDPCPGFSLAWNLWNKF